MQSVDDFRRRLDSKTLEIVDALRAIASSASADLTEQIKWNAPSFAVADEDRITLGIERSGGVRLVLHRGAKKKDSPFAFDDPDGLAKWPSPDRGVIVFKNIAAVDAERGPLSDLCRRWIEQTGRPRDAAE